MKQLIGLFLLAILVIIGVFVYPQIKSASSELPVSPDQALQNELLPQRGVEIKTYTGTRVTFMYPAEWEPVPNKLTSSLFEVVMLGIPGEHYGEDMLGFSSTRLDQIDRTGLAKEENLLYRDREWIKHVRVGNGYVIYDFLTQSPFDSGTFALHVKSATESAELEEQLGALVRTLEFLPVASP